MIKRLETYDECQICDNLLTKLILDERKYDQTIINNFKVVNYFEEIIKNDDNIVLIAKKNKDIVGFIYAKKNNDPTLIKDGYQIDSLYVEDKYRLQKIGSNLINKMLKLLRKKADFIEINVIYQNKSAKKLYEKYGFKEFKVTYRKENKDEK